MKSQGKVKIFDKKNKKYIIENVIYFFNITLYMKLQNKKGFTLIELLVVITIIGILATGATATYTSQIQKARDTSRVNDIKAVQSWVEQYYGDQAEYPAVVSSGTIAQYAPKIPKDSKNGQTAAVTSGSEYLGYGYMTGSSAEWVTGQRFELSTAFENKWNLTGKADNAKDNGNEVNRFEIWVASSSWVLNLTTSTGAYFGQ